MAPAPSTASTALPGPKQLYRAGLRLAQTLYGSDLISGPCPVTRWLQTEGHVRLDSPAGDDKPVRLVRAPMGSGKTTALVLHLRAFLNAAPQRRVLIVSCRRSFTQATLDRLERDGVTGFVSYLDAPTRVLDPAVYPLLIVQLESLHRLKLTAGSRPPYDFLILDEIMSLVNQFFSDTIRAYVTEVDRVFLALLRDCPRILAMDAAANRQILEMLVRLRGADRVGLLINTYASPGFSQRKVFLVPKLGLDHLLGVLDPEDEAAHSSETATFFGLLRLALEAGENLAIFCSISTFAHAIEKFAARFATSVRLIKGGDRVGDVNNWSESQVVIYTSVVTVGLSFDAEHFHSMFAYVRPTQGGPDMMTAYQALGRVRTLLRNRVYLHLDACGCRCDSTVAPMLLNREPDWPPEFVAEAEGFVLDFAARVAGEPRGQESVLRRFFRSRHFVESRTLCSLNDSFSLLHELLTNNRMTVGLWSEYGRPLDLPGYLAFLREARADARASVRLHGKVRAAIQKRKNVDALDPGTVDLEDRACAFRRKYLRPGVGTPDFLYLVDLFASAPNRARFFNAVMTAVASSGITCREQLYRLTAYYQQDWVPVNVAGALRYELFRRRAPGASGWPEVFVLCSELTADLGLTGFSDLTTIVEETAIARAVGRRYERCQRALFHTLGRYFRHASRLNRESLIYGAKLSGASLRETMTEPKFADHCLAVLNGLWTHVYGNKWIRKQGSFTGEKRMKNLTKKEIGRLLTAKGVDVSSLKTFRELYETLKSFRHLFQIKRYRQRGFSWHTYVPAALQPPALEPWPADEPESKTRLSGPLGHATVG
ncbi:F-UL9 protein [Chelonid alphaherpesvirus 5]|uniref:Replication origin-binding protein n=1 Tax=Chelonid alphaherpesvirus 5 TaxID=702736 RepID=V5NXC8_9ALPH|nr:F-UL9 protein [Chelonid alphaherpesvirus 5]AHA93329.1 F-UL9 protein [Chelonid alphaherpesvirus 5]